MIVCVVLDSVELKILLTGAELREVPEGTDLVREGEPMKYVYRIKRGGCYSASKALR